MAQSKKARKEIHLIMLIRLLDAFPKKNELWLLCIVYNFKEYIYNMSHLQMWRTKRRKKTDDFGELKKHRP